MQSAPDGAPEQDTCTVPAKPSPDVRMSEYVAEEPGFTVTEVGETEGTKSGGPAQPVRASLCVPALALSVNVRMPLRGPFAVGVKVTWIEQLSLIASAFAHELVWLNSPLTAILVTERGALPALESTSVWGELDVPTFCAPNCSEDAVKLGAGVLSHTDAVCGGVPVGLLVLNCTRSTMPSPFRSPTV